MVRRRSRRAEGRTIGVRGGDWRGVVDDAGAVTPLDGSPRLWWAVAAEDRWYRPEAEPSRRQRWYGGTPVAETRVRVPGGDVVSRAFCSADLGGITIVEFENESALPVAVSLSRNDLLTSSPPSTTRPEGIEMPPTSMVIPVGHRATARVGLRHDTPARGLLPADVAGAPAVVRGWETAVDGASHLVLPDHEAVAAAVRVRCDLMLGDTMPTDVHALIEIARLELATGRGEASTADGTSIGATAGATPVTETRVTEEMLVELTVAAGRLLRRQRRARFTAWDVPHLLANIARLCLVADEQPAVDDIAAAWLRIADQPVEPAPTTAPAGPAIVAWLESVVARPTPSGGRCTVFPTGIPRGWWGQNMEFRGITADPRRSLSAAVRWHGERPALLWEVEGPPGLTLDAGGEWCSSESRGETLLPAPTVTST